MKRILFSIFILSLLLVAGCSKSNPDAISHDKTQAMPATGHEVANEMVSGSDGNGKMDGHDVMMTGETKEFDMIAKQWEFIPDTIEVNLGDKVDIHVRSIDVTHGFMLPEFGINERLPVGGVVHIEFTADKAGEFPFACSVPCGSGHGRMSGQIIVR